MLTQQQLDATVYVMSSDFRISSMSYAAFLDEYGRDMCTSPIGNQPRIHIREAQGDTTTYQIWTWGTNGNHPRLFQDFGTDLQAAQLDLYGYYHEYYLQQDNAPSTYDSEDAAIEFTASGIGKPFDVLKRYIGFLKRADEQNRIDQERVEREYGALLQQTTDEAAAIQVDEEFQRAIRTARNIADSTNKTKAISAAFLALLDRLKYGRIRSDFWKVYNLLAKKIA